MVSFVCQSLGYPIASAPALRACHRSGASCSWRSCVALLRGRKTARVARTQSIVFVLMETLLTSHGEDRMHSHSLSNARHCPRMICCGGFDENVRLRWIERATNQLQRQPADRSGYICIDAFVCRASPRMVNNV